MNILSFDIEEWYIEKKYHGGSQEKYENFDNALVRILELLERCDTKATFFCLGKIATDFPNVIKQIAAQGHEIGCHSNEHGWLTKMDEKTLRRDTQDAIAALEDVSGKKVESYRAPAFSIGEANKWAFDVLADCGITRDASIFPASRDFGGFPSFKSHEPCLLDNGRILEFPIPTMKFLGKEFAFSGGGYFRFFPYNMISHQIENSDYSMCYFHIGDLLTDKKKFMSKQQYERYFKEPGSFVNRLKRYVKSNIGTSDAMAKMEKLISTHVFVSLQQAVNHHLI